MKMNLIACIILAAVVAYTPLKGQSYGLRSFEGKKVTVHVEALPHELSVSCFHDTLLLYEYFGDYHAIAFNSGLLQITYAVRGGSGFGLENTAILAVRDGHLRQALLLTSSCQAVGFKYHKTLNTGLKLTGNGWSNYVLTVTARKYLRDESHPSGIHKSFQPLRLRFNEDLMAFYGNTVVADAGFNAIEFNRSKEYIHFAAGDTLAMIKLADDRYYYVEGSWYSPMDVTHFLQQDTVIDKVLKLPTVQQKSEWVDSVTRHRHGISLTMLETADWPSDTGHYVLQVGYHSRQWFDPYYLFKVYQPDLAIKTFIQTKQMENGCFNGDTLPKVQEPAFRTEGEWEAHEVQQLFRNNYAPQTYPLFEGAITRMAPGSYRFGSLTMRMDSTSDGMMDLLSRGLLYPDLFVPVFSPTDTLSIGNFVELKSLSPSPQVRRFSCWVSNQRMANPTWYVFELTDKNGTTDMDMASFIRDARLSFVYQVGVII
jgi:hypothetical protein